MFSGKCDNSILLLAIVPFLFFALLSYSYLWLPPKVLTLGNEKKNKLFFCISLVYSYLCPQICATRARIHKNYMKDLLRKLFSPIIWGNLLAMVVAAVLLVFLVWQGMRLYTHHGEKIEVPNVKGMLLEDAKFNLEKVDLVAEVADSSYNRSLPAGTILDQTPAKGKKVKSGRTIFLTINSREMPTLVMPDIADNCSLREAQAKLKALGFKLGNVEYVHGDKDWVMDVKCGGHHVAAGERVSIDTPVILVVGNDTDVFDEFEEDSLEVDTLMDISGLADFETELDE